jgi:hypothetical protein
MVPGVVLLVALPASLNRWLFSIKNRPGGF